MNYYEEFGVPRSASQREIRSAWKRLARFYHPDLQMDAELRETAELQMRRLNQILSVLTEPWERVRYDMMLEAERSAPPQRYEPPVLRNQLQELLRFDRKAAVWLAAGALISGILVAVVLTSLQIGTTADYAAGGSSSDVDASRLPDTAASLKSRADQASPKFRRLETSPSTTKIAPKEYVAIVGIPASVKPELSPASAEPDSAPVRGSISSEAQPEHPLLEPLLLPLTLPLPVPGATGEATLAPALPPPTIAVNPPVGAAELARIPQPPGLSPASGPLEVTQSTRHTRRLAGLWRYDQANETNQSPGFYAAERVELAVNDESGVIRGYYTAHYRVPAGGVSPDVRFKFSGQPGQDAATGRWSGANGNRGEIRLRVLSDNALEVFWVATSVKHANSLISGKETLRRAN